MTERETAAPRQRFTVTTRHGRGWALRWEAVSTATSETPYLPGDNGRLNRQ